MIDLFIGTAWAQSGGPPSTSAQLTQMVVMMVLFVGIYYFVALRPQQKAQEQHNQLLASIQKGDAVITSSGLHGKVAEVEEKVLHLEIAKGVKVKWEKSRIARVDRGSAEAKPDEQKA